MPPWLEMLILSVVQGIAEFMPISSSGHLVLLQTFFGSLPDTMLVNIVLHAGTLLSICVVYYRQILALLSSHRRVIWLMFIGTLPAAVFGVTIKLLFEDVLINPWLTSCMLIITGCGLLWIQKQPEGPTDYSEMTWKQALGIGCFQAIGVLPGISRSGATIFAGLLLGLNRQSAATFSFLLAIPAILGATVLELKNIFEMDPAQSPRLLLLGGAMISFLVGCFALLWLMHWIRKGKLYYFAYWCIPVGILSLVWLAFKG